MGKTRQTNRNGNIAAALHHPVRRHRRAIIAQLRIKAKRRIKQDANYMIAELHPEAPLPHDEHFLTTFVHVPWKLPITFTAFTA